MAKGKHAAAAAKRRLQAAEEEVQNLRATLDDERTAAREREQHLKGEIQSLRNRLHSEVAEMAAERINELEERHLQAMKEAKATADARVRNGLARMREGMRHPELIMCTYEDWTATANAFGLTLGEFMDFAGKQETNREERRIRPSHVNEGKSRELTSPAVRTRRIRDGEENAYPKGVSGA